MDRRHFIASAGLPLAGLSAPARGAQSIWPDSDAARPPPPDPRLPNLGPGRRFAADGQPQQWPGCTVISQIAPVNPLFEALCRLRDNLRGDTAARQKLTWMPEHSYHMTVADLVNVAHRGSRTDWPSALALESPLAAACQHAADRLRSFSSGDTATIQMRMDPLSIRTGLLPDGQPRPYILWQPADQRQARRLRDLRTRIFEAIGVHHAGEASYEFHTTLAYPIALFTPIEAARYDQLYVQGMQALTSELPTITLPVPDYCLFESMYRFEKRFRVA